MLTVAQIREDRGLSQATLAARAKISIGVVSNMETGRMTPRMDNRLAIAEVLIDAAPLNDDELAVLSSALSVDARALLKMQRDLAVRTGAPADAARERVHREIDRLMNEYGAEKVWYIVLGSASALERARDEEASSEHTRRVVVTGPPVQRPGYVEQVETEYEDLRPEPTAPAAKPKKRARA